MSKELVDLYQNAILSVFHNITKIDNSWWKMLIPAKVCHVIYILFGSSLSEVWWLYHIS